VETRLIYCFIYGLNTLRIFLRIQTQTTVQKESQLIQRLLVAAQMPNSLFYQQATLLLPKSSTHYKKVTDTICYFLARDMQPYDTINDVGFCHMLKVLEPRYSPPDRKTVANAYFPKLYEAEREKLQNAESFYYQRYVDFSS